MGNGLVALGCILVAPAQKLLKQSGIWTRMVLMGMEINAHHDIHEGYQFGEIPKDSEGLGLYTRVERVENRCESCF